LVFFLVEAANKPSLFCAILHCASSAGVVATRGYGSLSLTLKTAYDHVDREALWHHLQHVIGVPPQLLTVIQNMHVFW
jgi:hypothetical protein